MSSNRESAVPAGQRSLDFKAELDAVRAEIHKVRLLVSFQDLLMRGILPLLTPEQRTAVDDRLTLIEVDGFEIMGASPNEADAILFGWVEQMRGALHGC